MTATRRLILVAAAALPLALAACDNKCPTSTAKIATDPGGSPVGVPTCSNMQAGATVQVKLGVCPRCDQANDVCTYEPPQGDTTLQLDPLVQTCDANPSCPIGGTCAPVTCTFKAPAVGGTYTLRVIDADLGAIDRTFTVVDSGGTTSCGV
jgi:hypothetical protein